MKAKDGTVKEVKNSIMKELLASVAKNPEAAAEKLFSCFGSLRGIVEAECEEIRDALDGDISTALYIKLAVALASRRECDKLTFGKKHSQDEIESYFKAFFFGISVETVAIMSIDSQGRVVAVDKAGEGTVNFSNVMPRKVLEIAKRRKAKSVIIVHNHPGGYPKPSDDDIVSARLLSEMLLISGIEVAQTYIVAGNECVSSDAK